MKKVFAILVLVGGLALSALSVFMIIYSLGTGFDRLVPNPDQRVYAVNTIRSVSGILTFIGLAGVATGIGLLRTRGALFFISAGLLAFAAVPACYFINRLNTSNQLPPNEMPMYGGVAKTPQMEAADREFIETMVKQFGSRRKAAEMISARGWDYVNQGDTGTAMKRFNQAWLLDLDYEGSYWGFGALLGMKRDINGSIQMLEKAFSINTQNPRLATDLARSLSFRGQQKPGGSESRDADFQRADDLFRASVAMDPNLERVHSEWAISLFLRGDPAGAWKQVHAARRLGGRALDPRFLEDLVKQMEDPGED